MSWTFWPSLRYLCVKKIKNQNKKGRVTDYWGFPHPANIDLKTWRFWVWIVSYPVSMFLEMQLEYNQIEDTVYPQFHTINIYSFYCISRMEEDIPIQSIDFFLNIW